MALSVVMTTACGKASVAAVAIWDTVATPKLLPRNCDTSCNAKMLGFFFLLVQLFRLRTVKSCVAEG